MAFKYNPFQPNRMVAAGMFVGRMDEISSIEKALFQAQNENPQHFLIEGERGIGKSSLIFLTSIIASGDVSDEPNVIRRFTVANTDLTGVESQLDIVRVVGRELRSAILRFDDLAAACPQATRMADGWGLIQSSAQTNSRQSSDDAIEMLIRLCLKITEEAADAIGGILIVMDEADAPPESAGLGEFVKIFTERMTRAGCNRVVLGLSGLPSTIAKLRASHESSPRVFEVLKLMPLEEDERKEVINKALKVASLRNGFDTEITVEAMDYLCDLTEGYPHFIQQFAFSAFDEDSDNTIDMDDVVSGAFKENGALMQLGSKYFNEMYFGRISSSEYRKVLDAMAPYSDAWVARKTLVAEAGVKETTLNNALNTLKAKNVIIQEEARQGFYRLPTKSFATWINAIRSLEERNEGGSGTLFDDFPS